MSTTTDTSTETHAPGPKVATQITPAIKTEIKELLDRWNHAISDSGNNDDEHEAGCDMAELLWQLHGDLPVSQ